MIKAIEYCGTKYGLSVSLDVIGYFLERWIDNAVSQVFDSEQDAIDALKTRRVVWYS